MNIEGKVEGGVESFPTKQEIFELLGVDAEKCKIGQEKSDENGLYRLDFTLDNGNEYDYMRAGVFEGSHKSPDQTFITETTPSTWPDKILIYEDGNWKDLREKK